MKKFITITLGVIFFMLVGLLIVGGLTPVSSVYTVGDYHVSDDGSEITFTAVNSSSIGFIRGYKDKKEGNSHYLTFYHCFGFINSSLGAKDNHTVKLDPQDNEIYFVRGDEPRLVFEKDSSTGMWREAD